MSEYDGLEEMRKFFREREAAKNFKQNVPITPQTNDLWIHGQEYCFCYTDPRGQMRLIYGDGATVPVKDYVIDGNAGYYLAWRGDNNVKP